MLFKAAIFATFVALAASQQAIQQYTPAFYNNVPGNLVFPQRQQIFDYNYGQYQGQYAFNFNNIFKQYPFISLVNNQNQPLGYIYWAKSDIVLQQQQNFLPIKDFYGNLLGYFSLYKPGQQIQPQILNENVISQLGQFGFLYNQPNQDKFGFIVVKNPNVFYYHNNGVLTPNAFQNAGFRFQLPYNSFTPKYPSQYQYPQQYYYGQEYQGQYVPRYQGQFFPTYQLPYNYNQYIPTY